MHRTLTAFLLALALPLAAPADEPRPVKNGPPLPGTQPLTLDGDLASRLVDGVDKFLLAEIDAAVPRRARHWHRDFSSPDAYAKSVEPNRRRLAHILGVRDPRAPFDAPELIATVDRPARLAQGPGYDVLAVRWPACDGFHGEGLLLVPAGRGRRADIIALPDADVTPEQLIGLADGVPAASQFPRRLAEAGCRVLVPALVDRSREKRHGRANLTQREYLYRPAFELGRHPIGYEVQKALAALDWLHKDAAGKTKVGIMGHGEGGLIALAAAALDPRLDAAGVSSFFDDRRTVWQQPIDRNVFGLLDQFGDAELASLIAPRPLIIEAARGPELTLTGEGGAPARLTTPALPAVEAEIRRARDLVAGLKLAPVLEFVPSGDGTGPYGTDKALSLLLAAVAPDSKLPPAGAAPKPTGPLPDPVARRTRQVQELDRFTQRLLTESPYVRQQFMSRLDTSSPEKFRATQADYRRLFRDEVIGRFDRPLLPPAPRTRLAYEADRWTGYEVALDVFPDVIAYGLLLLPRDLKPGDRRPVVVCQHGLEGRPQDVIGKQGHDAYKAFAARLADEGFITFAPQNLYIFQDRFRTLQRKANPLGKTLFSVIVPQHQQITSWLKTLPNVDPARIAFYGLSYGGKSAMRIPPLVDDYCLSICSADFNEWVWKNASTHSPYSYVWTPEYEIFEFDLGSTFNYAEMAALIAPRPFMVERGHFDGVAPDETVGYEFAKVRNFYAARLKLPDRCEIDWFVGPHTINAQGTFAFLRKHLNWKP